MRAAWWWIDRWRKSTAYTDMSLAEQGAYRNLLDELWLRDGLLPNDERILAKICGDPFDWPSVRDKVLARFTLTPDGWRNETHDEVSSGVGRFRESQAEKGRKGAAARWSKDGPANGPANSRANDLPSPSPSPSPLPKRKRTTDSVAIAPASWSREACDDWIAAYQGTAPGGKIGKALAPLLRTLSWKDAIRPAWQCYLRETEPQYASPQRFASTFGRWGHRPSKPVDTVAADNTAKLASEVEEWLNARGGVQKVAGAIRESGLPPRDYLKRENAPQWTLARVGPIWASLS